MDQKSFQSKKYTEIKKDFFLGSNDLLLISKLQIHWSDRFHFCHLLHPGYREARKNRAIMSEIFLKMSMIKADL